MTIKQCTWYLGLSAYGAVDLNIILTHQVDAQSNAANDENKFGIFYLFRLQKPLDGLHSDGEAESHQENRVDKGPHNLTIWFRDKVKAWKQMYSLTSALAQPKVFLLHSFGLMVMLM